MSSVASIGVRGAISCAFSSSSLASFVSWLASSSILKSKTATSRTVDGDCLKLEGGVGISLRLLVRIGTSESVEDSRALLDCRLEREKAFWCTGVVVCRFLPLFGPFGLISSSSADVDADALNNFQGVSYHYGQQN